MPCSMGAQKVKTNDEGRVDLDLHVSFEADLGKCGLLSELVTRPADTATRCAMVNWYYSKWLLYLRLMTEEDRRGRLVSFFTQHWA